MEDEKIDTIDPEYFKGFNDSYLIAQHMSGLSEKLSKIEGDSSRLQGMRDGRQQYLVDQVKGKLPHWLKTDKTSKENQPTNKKPKTRDVDPPSK